MMKKITLLSLLMILPFIMKGQTLKQTYDFDTDAEGWAGGSGTSTSVASGELTLNFTGATTAALNQNDHYVDAANSKYLHVILTNNSPEATQLRYKWPKSPSGTWVSSVDLTQGYNSYTIQMPTGGANDWNGNIDDFYFHVRNKAATSTVLTGSVVFEKIIFDNNATLPTQSKSTFNLNSATDGWLGNSGITHDFDTNPGYMQITSDGSKAQPNIALDDSKYYIQAGDGSSYNNRYMHIKFRNLAGGTVEELRIVFPKSSNGEDEYVNINNGEVPFPETFTVLALDLAEGEAAAASEWQGMISDLKIRINNSTRTVHTSSFEIDYIIFDNNNTLKVESLEKYNFSYYPNPTQNNIHINAEEGVEEIIIYNLTGQVVKNARVKGIKNPNIDVSELPTGIYNMKVKINDSIGVFKFIKK